MKQVAPAQTSGTKKGPHMAGLRLMMKLRFQQNRIPVKPKLESKKNFRRLYEVQER
jgi:hypothetical protein